MANEEEPTHLITNEELKAKLETDEDIVVLDVRQYEEYEQNHIQGATLIPLNELQTRYTELDHKDEIYIVCEVGGRSDLAVRFLLQKGFQKVANVLPGMSEWNE